MDNLLLTDEIIFELKPDAVPYNYRISYKLSQLCLIIGYNTTGNVGCSLVKLHILSSAFNAESYMKLLNNYLNGTSANMIVRFDSAVNRGVKYAFAEELIYQLKNGTFRLTEKGEQFISKINAEADLLLKEKEYLSTLGKKLTNKKIENLMSIWRYKNAKTK